MRLWRGPSVYGAKDLIDQAVGNDNGDGGVERMRLTSTQWGVIDF